MAKGEKHAKYPAEFKPAVVTFSQTLGNNPHGIVAYWLPAVRRVTFRKVGGAARLHMALPPDAVVIGSYEHPASRRMFVEDLLVTVAGCA